MGCINPLTVIHQCKNGELSSTMDAMQTMDEIINEILALTTHLGKDKYLEGIEEEVSGVIAATAENTSSMLQDVQNKQSNTCTACIKRTKHYAGIRCGTI